MAAAVAEAGAAPDAIATLTEIVWTTLHGLVTLSITKRIRPGRALHQLRLEQLLAAIVAMSTHAM